ncbi:gap junction alpha-3 protein-like [Anableps anableps]
MGDGLLKNLLVTAQKSSTNVGKIWLTVHLIFRVSVLGLAAAKVWDDEQHSFTCDTKQPGCENVCYDKTFPISHIRFWVLQVIFVSAPTLIYLGHILLFSLGKDDEQKEEDNDSTSEDDLSLIKPQKAFVTYKAYNVDFNGTLLQTYVLSIVFKMMLETGFITAQCCLYGFELKPMYACYHWPCSNPVNCYSSRPTEKTVFMLFMLMVASLCLMLNVAEMHSLGSEKLLRGLCFKEPKYNKDGMLETEKVRRREVV